MRMPDWEISLTRYCDTLWESGGPGESALVREVRQALTEISRLQAIVVAQREIIGWYEEEMERSCHEDSNIPEELRQLEQALEAAEAAEGET